MMHAFTLVEFEPDVHVTAQVTRWRALLADTAVTYRVRPGAGEGLTRLLVKVVLHHPGPRALRPALRTFLPLADTVMMHRQLANLKRLAERDASREGRG